MSGKVEGSLRAGLRSPELALPLMSGNMDPSVPLFLFLKDLKQVPMPSVELGAGLELMTLRPRPELRSRVGPSHPGTPVPFK